MPTHLTPEEAADKLRHLAVDAMRKMNSEDELDRTYILEDLIMDMGQLARELDGHVGGLDLLDGMRYTRAYPLEDRMEFGDLKGLHEREVR